VYTLDALNNLGVAYKNLKDYEKAKECYEKAYKGYEKVLGPDHASTQRSKNNLQRVIGLINNK
jgi:tetratricopeptide (TPR) repeat protein